MPFFFLVLFSDKKVIGREGGSHLMNRGKIREMDKKGLGGRSDETHMPPCNAYINFNYSFFFLFLEIHILLTCLQRRAESL